jgi:hypothetical protein
VIANFETFSKFVKGALFEVVALAKVDEVPAYVWPQTVDGRIRTCACADVASKEFEMSTAESKAILIFALFVLNLPHILRNAIRMR